MNISAERLAACKFKIQQIAKLSHRNPDSLRLLAVSKTHPPEKIILLRDLGVREFGENYAQELAIKRQALRDVDLDFVYIGALQSNKIPLIVRHAAEIQSVCSIKHAKLIAKEAGRLGKVPYPVYILVNAGDEATKSGVPLQEVLGLAAEITSHCPELTLQGIMAIPPPLDENRPKIESAAFLIPQLYVELKELAGKVGKGLLSLGMSDDLEEALAAGSDCVRIGTALFGPREPRKV
jgi:PLP dependent protein